MIILIDDDKLMHLSWKLRADKSDKEFSSYFTIEDFIDSSRSVDAEALIYIDSHLGNNIKGEVEAKKLYDLGYRNIFLTTGYQDLKLQDFPWIKGITSKSPPF